MDVKILLVVFGTVFLAELGDKTQIATFLFAAKQAENLIPVFIGASLALICASGLAVIAGSLIADHLDPKVLSYCAGAAFIMIGLWTILRA